MTHNKLALLLDVLPEREPAPAHPAPTFHSGGDVLDYIRDESMGPDTDGSQARWRTEMRARSWPQAPSVHHPALGRRILTPEHLTGARVEEVRSYLNGGHHLTWLVLDRQHPSEGDRISVGAEDVTLADP